MILLVDIGNSRIKWALCEASEWRARGAAEHRGTEPDALFTTVWGEWAAPARILAANVAGKEMATALRAWARRTWSLEPEFLTPKRRACGVVNAYVEPQRLGADRWAALIGAHAAVDGPLCVVDCGSAVTIDALDTRGQHLGGLIIPGLQMMRGALIRNTSGIDEQALARGEGQVSVLARDTRGAVSGGTLYTLIAVIDRVAADLDAELRAPLTRIITGGAAEQLLSLLAGPYRHEPDLVLHGLMTLAESDK